MLLAQIITHVTAHALTSQDTTPTDSTGVNTALFNIARLCASFIGGALAVVLVYEGYQYMFSDSASRGMHLKRSLMIIIGGAMLVLLAIVLAPAIINAIQPAN